jgi:hypothetical protein
VTSISDRNVNQPTKMLTEGGVLRKRTTSSLAKLKPFLRTKRIAGTGKQSILTVTGDVLTLTGLLAWLMHVSCSNQGLLLLVGG